jgi:hypothetical protein
MALLQDLRAELQLAHEGLSLQVEGIHDFQQLDGLSSDTYAALAAADAQYTRRLTLLFAAIEVLDALVVDGYPVVENQDISENVRAELELQLTEATAHAEAVTGTLTFTEIV